VLVYLIFTSSIFQSTTSWDGVGPLPVLCFTQNQSKKIQNILHDMTVERYLDSALMSSFTRGVVFDHTLGFPGEGPEPRLVDLQQTYTRAVAGHSSTSSSSQISRMLESSRYVLRQLDKMKNRPPAEYLQLHFPLLLESSLCMEHQDDPPKIRKARSSFRKEQLRILSSLVSNSDVSDSRNCNSPVVCFTFVNLSNYIYISTYLSIYLSIYIYLYISIYI
jgi:hypothetical protein